MSKHVLDGIKIPGYTNKWSSIDEYKIGEKTYYLMENDYWGDETCFLVITPDFKEVYETYDDIETCLTDEGILTENINKSELKEKYVDIDAFESKELAQAFEDVEKELDDINKVLDTLYKTPEKYISTKSLKEASGHLYDAWKSLHKASGKKDNAFYEDLKGDTKTNKFNIKIETIVEGDLDEVVVSGNIEDVYDEQTLEDWYDFASNVESLIGRTCIVKNITLSKNPDSLSEYIDFYLKDVNGNQKEGLIDLRLSDHKSTSGARQLRKIKAKKIDNNFKLKSVIVNNKTFNSYDDALKHVEDLIKSLDSIEESLMKEEKISPKILEKGEDAYKKLDAVAKSLTKKSPNGYTYYVGDTYLDFGSNYKWTTILVDTSSPLNQFEAGYQALNPKEWEDIVNSDKNADEMADEILADEFCPDKPKEDALKSVMHDLRRI